MPELLKAPVTPAQQARDTLLGALVGLARATTNEPKTDDTDEVLNAGLRLAAQPDAPEKRLQRMLAIVQTEKHRVAPGCATCAMPCGNTNDYDFVRLWAAPESIRTLKLQMLSAAFALAQKRPQGQAQAAVYQLLFTLSPSRRGWLCTPECRWKHTSGLLHTGTNQRSRCLRSRAVHYRYPRSRTSRTCTCRFDRIPRIFMYRRPV